MLFKRNLLESITIISCCGSVACILLNCVTNISPLTGVWLPLYIFFVFIVSVTFSFKFIQWLLQLNKPIKYDFDALCVEYPYLSFVWRALPRVPQRSVTPVRECQEYDTNELSVISSVLERRLVSAWYVPYVSQEIGFPFACKQMLDQMIGRTFQICNKIETKDVFIDICSVLVSHLKEYKKAIKRHEKSPEIPIESHYKKFHISANSSKKYQSADHCTNILRIILKELVPWELWDTPHSELLVRILSKKLDNFIDSTLADPVWLNDKLLNLIKGKESPTDDIKEESKETTLEAKEEIAKEIPKEEVKEIAKDRDIPKVETTTIESALSTLITKSTAPILQRAINEELPAAVVSEKAEEVEEIPAKTTEPVDIKSSPVLRQRRGRQGRNEVKIYDRIIEGSVKTWETDVDLQCISLGQDLLASLNGEITLSRLWGQDPSEQESGRSDQPLWFGEEDNLDMEITDTSPKEPSPVKKEFSPKPADALLKDLQSTVHQAKTKIGDLQDEAAGMMEGLLDFGIAGLKKGLRFTGLSDDSQDKSPSHTKEKSLEKSSSPPYKEKSLEKTTSPIYKDKSSDKSTSHKEKDTSSPFHKGESGEKSSPPEVRSKLLEDKEGVTSTVIQKDDGSNTVPPLLKQQRVSSQDSVASLPKPILKGDFPPPLVPLSDSPEPEYEEAADLSTSIAKLRCLLQQRAEISPNRADEIWWEGAEETRGRTHHHHSSRPVDTATLADEYDMTVERNTSPGQTSNNMQRLDKLFQRTVTGVFNSIKTAVGAEGEGEAAPGAPPTDWTYVCTSIELSVGGAVARLVGSRRAYSHVDAALDSLDQLASPRARRPIPEDFEEWWWCCGGGWGAAGEVAAAAGLLCAHVPHRLAALLTADIVENLINAWLEDMTAWLKKQVFVVFEELADEKPDLGGAKPSSLRHFNLDETCEALAGKLPLLQVFGEEAVSNAIRLSVSSFSHKEVNKDVIFRVLDLLALHFKNSAGLRHSSFDAN